MGSKVLWVHFVGEVDRPMIVELQMYQPCLLILRCVLVLWPYDITERADKQHTVFEGGQLPSATLWLLPATPLGILCTFLDAQDSL